jgi:hypothetical protein
VIDAVAELDLEPFYASYRADGHGAAAHDPQMMATLLAYAYAVGERSSRGIERRWPRRSSSVSGQRPPSRCGVIAPSAWRHARDG